MLENTKRENNLTHKVALDVPCWGHILFIGTFYFYLFQAHYLKATALIKAARNDEALQEYFHCVALKPDWTKVKLEAQKVRFLYIN